MTQIAEIVTITKSSSALGVTLDKSKHRALDAKDFKSVYQMRKNDSKLNQSLTDSIENMISSWNLTEAKWKSALKTIKPENKNLIELQILANRIGMQTQLMSSVGESFAGTLRRLQQMAGS
jgi:hypothetical protein